MTKEKNRTQCGSRLQTVGQHLHGLERIGFADPGQLFELTHALGLFGAEQVALAGVHANQLAGAGNLEALGGAAMGLELHFRLGAIAWHY